MTTISLSDNETLIIGAGISGVSSALTIAFEDNKRVEKKTKLINDNPNLTDDQKKAAIARLESSRRKIIICDRATKLFCEASGIHPGREALGFHYGFWDTAKSNLEKSLEFSHVFDEMLCEAGLDKLHHIGDNFAKTSPDSTPPIARGSYSIHKDSKLKDRNGKQIKNVPKHMLELYLRLAVYYRKLKPEQQRAGKPEDFLKLYMPIDPEKTETLWKMYCEILYSDSTSELHTAGFGKTKDEFLSKLTPAPLYHAMRNTHDVVFTAETAEKLLDVSQFKSSVDTLLTKEPYKSQIQINYNTEITAIEQCADNGSEKLLSVKCRDTRNSERTTYLTNQATLATWQNNTEMVQKAGGNPHG